MESRIAQQCREELLETCRKMSAAERLQAFVNQSKVLAEIYWAGQAARTEQRVAPEQLSCSNKS